MRERTHPKEFLRFPVTSGTASLAIAVTLTMWARVDVSCLMTGPELRHGELWRLVTATLPHLSPMHLLFDVYWLWIFGTIIEPVLGSWPTLSLYIILGAGSS